MRQWKRLGELLKFGFEWVLGTSLVVQSLNLWDLGATTSWHGQIKKKGGSKRLHAKTGPRRICSIRADRSTHVAELCVEPSVTGVTPAGQSSGRGGD